VGSPDPIGLALAAARWLTYVASILLIGSAGSRFVTSRALRQAPGGIATAVDTAQARVFLAAACLLVLAVLVTLAVQVYSWFGPEGLGDRERLSLMVTGTRWGAGWTAAGWAAVASLGAAMLARFATRLRPVLGLLGALAVAFTVPLVGHGGAHGTLIRFAHAGHLLGAGLWIGTLAVLILTTWAIWQSTGSAVALLSNLLACFSPLALAGAALVGASGVVMSWQHIQPIATLWETDYGRTLAAKVAVVASVGLLGALNWRRFGPRVADEGARVDLRRAARSEVAIAFFVILSLTAWLAGLPIPATSE